MYTLRQVFGPNFCHYLDVENYLYRSRAFNFRMKKWLKINSKYYDDSVDYESYHNDLDVLPF